MNPYLNDSTEKRVMLEWDELILTNDDIQEDMTLAEQVNTATDLQFGACCAAQLDFTILDQSQELTKADLIGKEFRFRRGVQTGTTDVWDQMRRRGLALAVRDGLFWYGVNRNGKSLAVWNDTKRIADPVQPDLAVKSIFIRERVLYCGHEGGGVTAYTIGVDGGLVAKEVVLSAFERQKIGRYSKRGDAFHLDGDVLLLYRKDWGGGEVISCDEQVIEFWDAGYFTPGEADRKNDNLLTVKAYDRMKRFDVPVDDYLDSLSYPVALLPFLRGLCGFCGVGLATDDFSNKDFLVRQNILTLNLPGRDLLGWITQAAARFARFDAAGKLELVHYAQQDYTVTADMYAALTVSEYSTAPIDKVQIKATDDDFGVIEGVGENAYLVQGNPLFFADTDAELRPAAKVIYSQVGGISYTPYVLHCRGNPMIRAGDVISIESRKGQDVRAIIMSRTLKGVRALTDEYEATGNRYREAQPRENQSIKQLRGKVNEVSVTLDGTINRLYDAETGDVTQLRLTTEGLGTKVEDNTGNISTLQQTSQGLLMAVSGLGTSLDETSDAVNALGDRITGAESSIGVQADQIALKVSSTDYNGDTISSLINQNSTTILIRASRINLDGYVTASSLKTGDLLITGRLESVYGSEKVTLYDGYLKFYYGGSLRGSLYTNQNANQNFCISSKQGSLLFAAGGYLRGRILSDGTFDNQQYDYKSSGDIYLTGGGYYYASGNKGYSGTFEDKNGKHITVTRGIITDVR